MSITLTDKFDNSQGRFVNYDAYNDTDRDLLIDQAHVDIRSFITSEGHRITVLELGLLTMDDLELYTMAELDALSSVDLSEEWTTGTIEENPSYGYYNTLTLTAAGAETLTSSSVMYNPDGSIKTINILDGFEDTDQISVGFPDYPASLIDEASSYIDFTSHPTGDFTTGPTASVSLADGDIGSTLGLLPNPSLLPDLLLLPATTSEFRIIRSDFDQNGIDLSAITGVRFRIVTTGAATIVLFGGVRLLGSNWVRTNNDINTLTERLVRTPPTNGDYVSSPVTTLPVVWRSDTPAGESDPKPIDVEAGILFYTGNIANDNSIEIYFRERTLDFMTQLDLNGMTMGYLDGNAQPDLGTALYDPRAQNELDLFTQSELDGDRQYDLERTPDSVSSSWISIELQWTVTGGHFQFSNSEGVVYTHNIAVPLDNDQRYLFIPSLEENTVEARLYSVDENGAVNTLISGTSPSGDGATNVINDFEYKRRAGRFGWLSTIVDANAWVEGIVVRKAVFAEYRSRPLRSNTPVDGTQLFTTTSGPLSSFISMGPGPFNVESTLISYDNTKYTTGNSISVTGANFIPLQGTQSNLFYIENFEDLDIKFDIHCSDATKQPSVFLLSENRSAIIPLVIGPISSNQWYSVEAHLSIVKHVPESGTYLSGRYSLVILRPEFHPDPWWIDNVRIQTPSVIWDGRGEVGTAWELGSDVEKPWTPFKDAINSEVNGIVFPERGKTLQVRAKALTQDASITRIEVKPKYTQLGRVLEY